MVTLDELVAGVAPGDPAAAAAAQARSDGLVKPRGSLGRLEWLGARLAAIAGTAPPPIPRRPAVLVAAADHGVHARGVTPWPQEITAAMVGQFAAGGASVNAIAATVGAEVVVLDVGVAGEVGASPSVRSRRIRPGTGDLLAGPAMTRGEVGSALVAGAETAYALFDEGVDLLVTGDMGIANTTATSLLVAAFTGLTDPEAVLGRGAAIDDDSLARKRQVLRDALRLHRDAVAAFDDDPIGVVAAVGGLEHAALAGAILAAAGRRVPVVLDGVITDAAALVAQSLAPAIVDHLVAGHRSTEPAAGLALDRLGLEPLLDLELRLGEGTGGLLAVPLVQAAARILHDVSTIDDLTP